jgi:hypothetical protein
MGIALLYFTCLYNMLAHEFVQNWYAGCTVLFFSSAVIYDDLNLRHL